MGENWPVYRWTGSRQRKRFDAAKRGAGLPTLQWHDLRHTCATWLGQSGVSLDVIRQQLRHSSITMTQKYRHVARSEVRDALHALPTISPTGGNVVPMKRCK
ncbi:MAG: tyrosine-type recombinase/integrase [Hyphomicrobiaceae bacterium]|nr:tyrosine-type recombinase/integrase [Hyphomicrobiaceae bacterium]